MADEQQVFFIDDELIERMMRGDAAPSSSKTQRPAESASLAGALVLAAKGQIEEAVAKLETAAERGENPQEVHSGLGHLRFEQQKWREAELEYARVVAAEPKHKTAHYNLGLCLEKQGKFDEASRAFEAAIAIELKRWQAHLGLGFCRLKLNQAQLALESLEAAFENFPEHAAGAGADRILFGRAVALQQLGRLDEAADLYKKLLPAAPNSPEILANFIALSMARGDEARVKELSERLHKFQPESPAALKGLMWTALARGDYSSAVEHGTHLAKIATDSYEAWFNLGVAYQKTGRLEQALQAYQEALRLSPAAAEANANRGAVLQERGELSAAREAYGRSLETAPNLPGALWNLAIAAEREGDAAEAEALLEKLVAADPQWQDAAFRLGYFQLQRGSYGAAIASFEICLQKREDWPEAGFNLGLAAWKSGDLQKAENAFRALASRTHDAQATRAVAAVLVEQKKPQEALEWYRRLAQGEVAPELAYNLGLLLQATGEPAAAAECYQAAVDGNPRFHEALLNLGHALKDAGKEEEAREVWSRAEAADPARAGGHFE